MSKTSLKFYSVHNFVSDPGEFAGLLNDLPTAMDELHESLNGLLVHLWKIRKRKPRLLNARPNEVFVRRSRNLLGNIVRYDNQPLNVHRPEEKRGIVDCRHFATLLCAILRHRGIPARARCGFAAYLEDTHYEDHWVCEYWDSKAKYWVVEDADKKMHNVPPDQFITGVGAWQICRQDKSKGNLFGFGAKMRGMWAARVNLVRDFASLNGFESVSGDSWGLGYKDGSDLTGAELTLLDQAAEFSSSEEGFDSMRKLYLENGELQIPAVIHNFDFVKTRKWRSIEWQKED